jgi:putative inorganic carbon (HCO3(-)) transporter
VLGVAVVVFFPVTEFLVALDDTTKVQGAYGSLSISGRLEIWARAVAALRDFPLTGVGLGAFRAIVHAVYPLYLIPPDYDIAHAHNFFLQAGLDFGLFGLIAVVALYLLAAVQCSALWRTRLFAEHQAWGLGLLAALLGQAVYSLADAVAMGSKPNLLLWWLLGLIFGLTGSLVGRSQAGPAASAAPATAVEDQARFLPSSQ